MIIWRWEEFSRCDKFLTIPARLAGIKAGEGRSLVSGGR